MMDGGSKETLCTRCRHRPVCSHIKDAMKVYKKIDTLSIENDCGGDKICDLDWIKIDVNCRYHLPAARNVDEF